MSAGAQTKIFGLRLGLDPKILVVILVAIAGLLFWYNSGGDDAVPSSSAGNTQSAVNPPPSEVKPRAGVRHRGMRDDNGELRMRAVDATKGDVDPVLRLGLLERLQRVKPIVSGRNVFEASAGPGGAMQAGGVPVRQIIPKPLPMPPNLAQAAAAMAPRANIPLKYYGFARPEDRQEKSSGFFLDGENVVVAAEGQLIQQRYLVVQLTPNSAQLEDTQIKMGQTLPVIPEANAQ